MAETQGGGSPIAVARQFVADTLTNLTSQLMAGADKRQFDSYGRRIISPHELVNAYTGSWVAKKLINTPPEDMVREGRAWQANPEEISALEAVETRLQLLEKVKLAKQWARLYGGAALIIGTEDRDLREPLDPAKLKKGGLRYLHVATRYQLARETEETDVESPNFGKPRLWRYTPRNQGILGFLKGGAIIHASRVVVFSGDEIPPEMDHEGTGFGDSVLQAAWDAVLDADRAAAIAGTLLYELKVDILKTDVRTAAETEAGREGMLRRANLAALAKSTTGLMLIDKSEEWESRTINLSQVPETIRLALENVAAAADMPATRFLGRSPQGMNATGESDLRNYYDAVAVLQESELTPAMEVLDQCVIASALGPAALSRDEPVWYDWRPLWQPTLKEKHENAKSLADTVDKAAQTGLVPLEALAEGYRNALIESGLLPGLGDKLAEISESDAQAIRRPLNSADAEKMVRIWQSGAATLEDTFEVMKSAGLLRPGLTFEKYQAELEDAGSGEGTGV
ncbi:DUF1073 domain-containing protein [Oceanicaulis sp.]|uniref:DUF1073 domain-containing protein n=1 Tax=Oceanicaulis sp. TaxID=1924941 RepID=UPI003F6F5A31